MERKAYNKEIIHLTAICNLSKEHPTWSNEKIEKEAEKQDVIKRVVLALTELDLAHKLDEYYKGYWNWSECHETANYIMNNMEPQLIQNINEWIDEQPLSDIKIHGWSIKDIMCSPNKKRKVSFVEAMKCLIQWKENNYENKDFCILYFALA
jgi:hypothetical protein